MKKLLFTLSTLCLISAANAQWSTSPTVNNAICTDAGYQFTPTVASDGAGGAILAWMDMRAANGYTPKVYAQRIDANGILKWTTDGVSVCTSAGAQGNPQIAADGTGGAYIAFSDNRSGKDDVYLQRINGTGSPVWAAGGVAVCVLPFNQNTPQVIREKNGGAIVAWQDSSNGTASYLVALYAQKVNSAGAVQWAANGVQVTNTSYSSSFMNVVSDTAGGAIFCWADQRNVVNSHDIYAQRLNTAGAVQWTANGVVIANPINGQNGPNMIMDGTGGAIIVWGDNRNSNQHSDIYSQKINASGVVQWAANGAGVSINLNSNSNPQLCSDGAGGAIIAWEQSTPLADFNVYAQRITTLGVNAWIKDTAICKAVNYQLLPKIVSDKTGGAVIMWEDWRNGSSNYDIYAQRINSVGGVQWTVDGIAVSSAANNQSIVADVVPPMISDSCSTIMAWQDARNATSDVFAQRLQCDGTLGSLTEVYAPIKETQVTIYPIPFKESATVHISNSQSGRSAMVLYNVFGEEVRAWALNSEITTIYRRNLSPGIYFYTLFEGTFPVTNGKIVVE